MERHGAFLTKKFVSVTPRLLPCVSYSTSPTLPETRAMKGQNHWRRDCSSCLAPHRLSLVRPRRLQRQHQIKSSDTMSSRSKTGTRRRPRSYRFSGWVETSLVRRRYADPEASREEI